MKIRVDVKLKNGVLDPQGRAVAHALHTLGFDEVADVRIGKAIELEVNETDKEKAKARAVEMAQKLLANLVIESYTVEVLG
ncbi:phosphoribosylformylglycinamidine synthase subunit PurS [Pseudaquidulcibacter saccharophilus]|uniref:phosphoribosylformylglycinamidine synthase subunit PurS n=1 Tax=Pseudaquidulcibacter saccharophilus TaxID=2831900 RepID=UPI001EFF1313|nr:phosphoribosylformylglycinamidine synthase subunit PurS [Pseudaquidulcibacter saccharophilus]